MPKYIIITTETTTRRHTIEAETRELAEEKLFDYENGDGEVLGDIDANVQIESIKEAK